MVKSVPILSSWLLLSVLMGAAPNFTCAAEKAIPPPPQYYVLDEPHVLSQDTLNKLQLILVEQERVTGEQILISIFKSLEGQDLEAFTNRVFQEWKIGQARKSNGALLALYWEDRKARIEVGYGLEPLLTDAKSKSVLEDDLFPGLKNGNPDQALSQATLALLTHLESPLISNGKAAQILNSVRGSQRRDQLQDAGKLPWPLLLFFLVFVLIPLLRRLSPDAHYSAGGWTTRRHRGWTTFGGFGGGGFGGGGGGGGFSGGGGRSGGGGASGSW